MQASLVDKNKSQFKYLQIAIVTNIGAMLECFVSLYELRHSTLQEVFLNPSSQLEQKEAVNDIKVSSLELYFSLKGPLHCWSLPHEPIWTLPHD